MRATLLSDAHLARSDDPAQARFVGLVDALVDGPLVLCGDVFDAWWGFTRIDPEVAAAVDALGRARARGLTVVWVRGNRDFHAGPAIEALGIEVVDEWRGQVSGLRVLAVHGDRCDERRRQRLVTGVLRGPAPRALARVVGPRMTWAIARRLGRTSRSMIGPGDLLERQRAWADLRLGGDVDVVVMGHAHAPVCERRDRGTFVNLGSFSDHGTYAVIDVDGVQLASQPPSSWTDPRSTPPELA